MTPRNPARLRPWRATAAVVVMLVAAVSGHVAAGGALPSFGALVMLATMHAVVVAVVTRIGPRRWASLALLAATQYLTHQVLVLTAHWLAAASQGGAASCGHGHGLVAPCGVHLATGEVPGHDAGAGWSDARMVAFHVVATVATGLLLAQGDRAMAALLTALWPLRAHKRLANLPVAARYLHVVDVPAIIPVGLMHARRQRRRGPPPCVASAAAHTT